jgi:hypothetical protein
MTREKTWYKPREIARLGLIRNYAESDNEDSNYVFIHNLIKRGLLKASDYGLGQKKMWIISKKEIDRYNKTWRQP